MQQDGTVPDLGGGDVEDVHRRRDRRLVGKVVAQTPRKGKSLTKGAKVAVTVGKR